MFLKRRSELYMKLWAPEHPISGCSLHPACPFHVSAEIMAVPQKEKSSNSHSKAVPGLCCTGWLSPACSPCFSRGPCAALATTATCVRCALGSQASGAPGTGSARMASRALGSATASRGSMALPARCVKWGDTEPTANQVTPGAVAAWLYQTARKGRKVATSQPSGGVVGGQECPKTLRQAKGCQVSERETAGVSTCGQPEEHPQAKNVLCCAAHPAATQTTASRGKWSLPGLLGSEGSRADTPVTFS